MTALRVVKDQPAVPAASPVGARERAVDLFVEGQNLTARIPDADPVPLLCDLARATADLASLRARRRSVRCYSAEGPWEIGVEREGSRALFTLFRGGSFPEVCVYEREVELVALACALSQQLDARSADARTPDLDRARAEVERLEVAPSSKSSARISACVEPESETGVRI